MKNSHWILLACTLASGGFVACGGDDSTTIPPPGPDGGADGAVAKLDGGVVVDSSDATPADFDAAYGQPSSTYPAFTPWMGQLVDHGGAKLTSPILVTITWDGDNGRNTFEGFGDGVGASPYWSASVGEYGIGPTVSGSANHAHVSTAPPNQMTDQDIQDFVGSNIGTLLPAYTDQTLYIVYLSTSTTLIFGNSTACQAGVGGYHSNFFANGNNVAYAVLPRCGSDNAVTTASSHEIGEAATDAHPQTKPAIRQFADPYFAFETWQRNNNENGDACEFFKDSFYTEQQPFQYGVQRLWSNKQGPLGHSPCQPYAGPYFNMAPLDLQDVTVDLSQLGGSANFKTKGYLAGVGQTINVSLGFYSDQMTSVPWTVSVFESNPIVNQVMGRLAVSVDPAKTSGVNGEKTYIKVTVKQNPVKLELFTVVSTLNGVKHYLPLVISSP